VGSDVVVIADRGSQDSVQMRLAQDNQWSAHARRIELMSRSAKPFSHGEVTSSWFELRPASQNSYSRERQLIGPDSQRRLSRPPDQKRANQCDSQVADEAGNAYGEGDPPVRGMAQVLEQCDVQ
jgi:hypothetical protein